MYDVGMQPHPRSGADRPHAAQSWLIGGLSQFAAAVRQFFVGYAQGPPGC